MAKFRIKFYTQSTKGEDMKRTSLELLLAVGLLASIAPSVAADFTLEIFGNANMDETIDDADIAYVEEVIRGTKEIRVIPVLKSHQSSLILTVPQLPAQHI